jgi:hypothetical protein
MAAVPARTNLGIPFRRWICKDTLIRDRCKCKRDICQGGVVGYPRGLWILRPGFESRPWPFLFCEFFLHHFRPAHTLCFYLHITRLNRRSPVKIIAGNNEGEKEYPGYERYPIKRMPLPF